MRVAAARARGLDFRVAELLAKPRYRRARRDRAAEHVQVAPAVEHVRHADEPAPRVGRLGKVAPAHARADHRDVLAAPRRTRRERRDGRVDAARDDGRAHLEAERVRPFAQQPAHHRVRIDEPLRHHRRRNAQHVERLVGPVAAAQIVDAADVARRAVIDRELARQPIRDVRVRRHEVAHVRPHVGALLAQPQHLRVAVVAVDAVARDLAKPCDVDVRAHPVDLVGRAPVHPDEARMQRPHLAVDRNARAAVQAAHAERLDRLGADARRARVGAHPRDAFAHRVEPHVRPLLGPQRLGRVRPVRHRMLREDRAVEADEHRLRALGADVDTNHACHIASASR
ncbi:Uncharacterised protein [Burkholderia pseudomallei]|nr:Uncharacterised protein [Burkholderia pseudomallei]CAJ4365906.1 Uncharacterised protein [Burkholderia pseudomallei]CAJ9088539.1 Uncharacterised protein [Burkholderia pseudomallei]CAK0309018.1 Uncharacterised protein [Burkholderia pseudomallei]CAK0596908.1 Uncharacterised protein [Burkholderia pseudomallei]